MSLSTGSRLGVYEIVAPLGAGGMGEVYRARDTRLSREVAIKVLPAAVASDPDRRLRFEQEARSASALNHPNILTIYDVGSTDGTIYIAMELVEGKTLRELISGGEPVPMRRLLDVGTQTAEGLAKAHGAGIVHRDLKPENLMVSKDGFVKILDFGLAKLIEPSAASEQSALPTAVAPPTTPGTVMGTAGYMSPEQASGHAVDYRSDQFTLGAILYEMATGQRAFARKTGAETLVAIIREEPEPIAQLAPKSPAPVRWIVDRLLAKDPEERYASTKDLARDLRSVRDHLSETTTSASGQLEAAEPARAKRRGWLAPAILALVLGGTLAALAIRQLELFQPPPLQFQRLTFRRGLVGAARFAQDGKTVVYSASWDGGPMEVFSTSPESPESKSLGLPPSNLLAVSSGGELAIALGWRVLVGWESTGTLARVPLAGGAPREVVENVQDADWSPDGKELAVVNHTGPRARLEFPVGNTLAESSGWINHVRVSPDGKRVAFYDHAERGENAGALVIVDVATKRRIEGPFAGGTANLVWTRSGDIFASGGPSVMLRVSSSSGKARTGRGLGVGFVPEDLAADGTLLARRFNWRREIVGLAPGDDRERNLTWLDWSFPNTLSADGKLVLFDEQDRPRQDYLCYIRKMDGSPAVLLGKAKGLDLSPDGRWAVTTNPDATELTLIPTAAGAPRKLPKTNLTYQWAQFFPDGKTLLVWGNEPGRAGRLYVLDLASGRPRPLTPEGFSLTVGGGKAISPDGRTIALRSTDDRVYLMPSDGSKPPAPMPGTQAGDAAWGWTADGRSVYVGKLGMPTRIEICDVTTGQRQLWKEIVPPDPAGVLTIGPIYISADGKSYVYSYRRQLDDLFLVRGVE